jgi:hypothetical protein
MEEAEPEESKHSDVAVLETPRFNGDKKPVLKVRTDHLTFGSMASSPRSEAELSRRQRQFESSRTPNVMEMTWEDSTNKRDYIINLAKRKYALKKDTEDSMHRSANASLTNLVSLDLGSPTPTMHKTREASTEASRSTSMMARKQPKHQMTLETQQEAKSTGCCGPCLMYIFR